MLLVQKMLNKSSHAGDGCRHFFAAAPDEMKNDDDDDDMPNTGRADAADAKAERSIRPDERGYHFLP